MSMDINVSVDLPTDPAAVWAHLRDISRHTEWMHDAVEISFTSHQTEGVGTTFDCVTAVGPLRTTDRMEITRWEPSLAMGVRHSGVVTGEGEFILEPAGSPEGSETRFRWREQLRLPWFFGGRLGEIVAAPVLRFIWRRNLRGLRALILESQRGAPTPGQLIGTGRASEVRTHGDDQVIRIGVDGADQGHEADAMEHVRAHGYPAPAVIDRPDAASIVMQRLSGPTMLEELTSRPWTLRRHAKTLARLHRELGSIEAPKQWGQVSSGTAVVHLDLRPDNVKLTANGPVVIDWSHAGRGNPGFDAANTYVILRTAAAESGPARGLVIASLRRQFARAFVAAFGAEEVRANLTAAAELRLLDDSLSPLEREQVFALARGELD